MGKHTHARYTDAEAVAAMGAKGDANPLHHDRAVEWGATEHTAIGDAAPHHAEIHGADKHTDVTRTLFIPCGNYMSGTSRKADKHDVVELDKDTPQVVEIEFRVPSDFVSFGSLKVVWFSGVGGTAGQDWVCDPACSYAAHGEQSTTHGDTPANTTIDVTAKLFIYETDVGFTLANLAKGDYCGVEIERQADDGADNYGAVIRVMGLLLTYIAEQ